MRLFAIRRLHPTAAWLSALLALSGPAFAQAWSEPIPAPPTELYPGAREYVWTFSVPVVTTERYDIVTTGPRVIVRSKRFDYETPGLRYERRQLGWIPEFYCKYPDLVLPNECGVDWHKIYADFPQLTMRREHVDVDVAEVVSDERTFRIHVPRVTWTERTLRVLVPVWTTEPELPREWSQAEGTMVADTAVERARAGLEDARRNALKAIDDAVAALDASIATVEAQGGDAAKVAAADGSPVDLQAARRSLLADKAAQTKRYAQIAGELDAAGKPRETH